MSEPALKLEQDEQPVVAEAARTPPNVIPLPRPKSSSGLRKGSTFGEFVRDMRANAGTLFKSSIAGPYSEQLREAQRELMLDRTLVLIWMSMAVMPSANLGYAAVAVPELVPQIAGITAAAVVAVNIIRLAVSRGFFDEHYHQAMLLLVGVVFGMVCGTVVELTHAADATFLFAYFLVFFAYTALFPAEAKWIVATGFTLMGTAVAGRALAPGPFEVDPLFLSHLNYLGQLTFIGLVLNRVVCKLFFEERLAKIELDQANAGLRELDAAKTTFFSNISHELRTPLTLILTPLTHIVRHRSAELPQDVHERLKGVRGNANRLLKMVNSLLDFSRLEAGQVKVVTSEMRLDELVSYAASLFEGSAEQRGIQFKVASNAGKLNIVSDLDKLEQILVNLVGNAMKFTPEGGTITLRTERAGDRFQLIVADTGVGIAPEHQKMIFERFSQVQEAQKVSVRGTGIGLSMVREYAQLLGGTIELHSVPGEGSTFTVTLPVTCEGARLNTPVARELEEEEEHTPTAPVPARKKGTLFDEDLALADLVDENVGEERQRDLAGKGAPRVLVVDDNPDLVRLVSSILETRYNLYMAFNGEEALARLAKDPVDLVVSDVMMPGISGLELCQRIKADPRTRLVPVILLTARGGTVQKIEGLDSGADDYIGKPFDPEELLARIRSLFERRALMKELEDKSTELQLAMDKLKEEEVKLVASEKLRTLGDLAAGIFHELHNYMNMIYNGAQPLKELVSFQIDELKSGAPADDQEVAEIMELIDLMMQASHAALTVTGELKAYAHQSHNVIARVDLHDQVRSSVRMFGQWKGDLTVNLEFGDDPLMIDCVPSRLLMVFTNLVKNAFEAMDNNGEVTITSERDGDWAILKVRDTGPGVPEDYRPNLFQPFHTTKKQGEGLGLGLSLAHKVVHESGGELSYDASYTDGAQFLIRLPLA